MTRMVTAGTIAAALRRVKALPQLIEHDLVLDACRAAGHGWRDGPLNPLSTVTLFLIQVLHGNTAINHLRHLTPLAFTASAYCQARARLPLALFEHLLQSVTDAMFQTTDAIARWRGHRTFIIDGTTFTMPDTPALLSHFGHPSGQTPGCAFPVAHLMVLCDMATGLIRQITGAPLFTSDLTAGVKMCPLLRRGDLIIADRGFAGWAFYAVLEQHGLHTLIRAHQRLFLSFRRRVREHPHGVWTRLYLLDKDDQVIEWFKPGSCPQWMSKRDFAALMPSILIRIIRYSLRRRGFRPEEIIIMTTLTDHQRYPKQELIALYGRRWEIETNIRHLKQTMKMNELHCQSIAGVRKELTMFAIAYNLVRMEMTHAAAAQRIQPERISFVDALRALQARATTPAIHPRMTHDKRPPPTPALIVNPYRPNRCEPRAIKRRPPQRRLLTTPRAEARKRLQQQRLAA